MLSLLRNPEPTIRFLRDVEAAIPKGRVHVEFEDVHTITPDAPLLLLGTHRKFTRRMIGGSIPKSDDARAILEHSGFFDHVQHGLAIEGVCQGVMARYSGTEVDGELARRLIFYGTELLFGVPSDSEASYSILVEGMENTIAHAHRTPSDRGIAALKTESWWASVYVDRDRRRICFALVDLGVGILKSARVRMLKRIDRFFRRRADAGILSDILEGRLQSRTGLVNRGKGLPAIKKLGDLGLIKELTLVTNNVHAKLDTGEMTTLSDSFNGTLLYWEIEGEGPVHFGS